MVEGVLVPLCGRRTIKRGVICACAGRRIAAMVLGTKRCPGSGVVVIWCYRVTSRSGVSAGVMRPMLVMWMLGVRRC